MTWQQKALRKLIKTTRNADLRHSPIIELNASINNVHHIAASYEAICGRARLPKSDIWPNCETREAVTA